MTDKAKRPRKKRPIDYYKHKRSPEELKAYREQVEETRRKREEKRRLAEEAANVDGYIEPQPGPQTILVTCPFFEIFFGGARGGGKTFALILDFVSFADRNKHARGILFRKTYPELDEVKATADRIIIGGIKGSRFHASSRTYVLPNGATLKLRHLDRPDDADKYQGHQYQWAGFDEVPNWASPDAINKIRATIRDGKELRLVMTGNPGGPGHNWVKSRFIDPAPLGLTPIRSKSTKTTRIFIPSKIEDNKALLSRDPGYIDRLRASGPEWLVKAWIDGDWNIVAGGMFDDVWRNDKNIVRPFILPRTWRVDRSFDWGSSAPFSVGWWAEADGTEAKRKDGSVFCPPRGSIIRIAEWYGWDGTPNTGIRMLARDIARGIVERERQMFGSRKVMPGPADTNIFSAENGVCIADDMAKEGVKWTRADKRPGSRVTGWDRMRGMIAEASKERPEEPALYVTPNCQQFIRTVPLLPRDSRDIDDVDTTAEDHIADETRYRVQQVKRVLRSVKVEGL